jgi:hypothetical protein
MLQRFGNTCCLHLQIDKTKSHALEMTAASASKRLAPIYQTTRRHISEDSTSKCEELFRSVTDPGHWHLASLNAERPRLNMQAVELFEAPWQRHAPHAVTKRSAVFQHSVFVCLVRSNNKQHYSFYGVDRLIY